MSSGINVITTTATNCIEMKMRDSNSKDYYKTLKMTIDEAETLLYNLRCSIADAKKYQRENIK
jgi:glutamine synthetase type III